MKNRASALLMILCCIPLAGCITRLFGGGGEPTVAGEKGSILLSKLERIVFNFADRDVTLISDACETIKRENATADERRRAQHFKLANGTAVYDIVTSPNSLGHLVDLYVMIHLQHLVLVDEGNGGKRFGEKGAARLTTVLDQLKNEIDHLANLSMKSKRKAQLDKMIQDWRQANPNVEFISGIRFGNLPELSGKSILEVIPSFFDVLNPLDDTSRSVEETRQVAERAFYFSKRLPKLLDWQVDSALDDTMAKPEVNQVLKDVTRTSASIDRVSKVIERVPDLVAAERKEILAALGEIRSTLAEGKDLASELRGAGKALELTFDALHRVVERAREDPRGEASKPFDIADYTAAATEISKMARDANSLVNDGQSLLSSPAWTARQEDVSRLASETIGRTERGSRRVADHLALRMVQVLITFFGLLLLYRVVVRQIEGKRIVRSAARMNSKADRPPPELLKPS
jgi:molybdenum-dependent DNA-binding transcriptional regulator ModE